jgi:SAM-dependent methyltransferase
MFAPMFDDWSPDDFGKHIYNSEYLAVDGEYAGARPKNLAENMAVLLRDFKGARLLDYGSGTGLFAENMRASGFADITSYDPFSQPSRPSGRFDIITCFEVVEHSPTPLETFRDIASLLRDEGCVILGQVLQPPDIDVIRCNWWYCMPRNGHVSLYTDRALALLATRCGLLFHQGDNPHALSRPTAGRFAELANRFSLPLLPVCLGAPPAVDRSADTLTSWQGVESLGGTPTRWTAKAEISWRFTLPSLQGGVVRIRVPFKNEVRPGFAAQSKVLVDGVEARTCVADRAIVAETVVTGRSSIDVVLRTPPVLSPSALRDSADRRELGLAIPCQAIEAPAHH